MKGLTLEEIGYLILAVLLVLILLGIFFIFQFPFMVFPIVLFDHVSTLIRGFVISGIWATFYTFFGIITLLAVIATDMNPSCWGPQALGCVAKNAILWGIAIGFLTWAAFAATSSIPLFYMNVKLTVSNNTVNKNLADWVVDTSYMASSGNGDPFAGTSSNPKISFIIKVKKGNVNLYHALYNLYWPTYSVWDKIKGKVWDDDGVIINANWHVPPFKVSFNITKSGSNYYLYIWNETSGKSCTFSGSNHIRLDKFSNGGLKPQEKTANCDGTDYKVFVGQSLSNSARAHVTMGDYTLKFMKLKSVSVYKGGKWIDVVSGNHNFDVSKLKNVEVNKGKTIYIDYLDTCGLCKYHATECGGNLAGIEGVYICIP